MFQSEHLSNEEFLTKLKLLNPSQENNLGINNLLECITDLNETEKRIDKALSKKRTEIQEYLTFCPQDIFTNLRIYINTQWELRPKNEGLQLNFFIFGQFLVNDDEKQLESVSLENDMFKFLRVHNFVDLIRELRIDFLNFVSEFF
jgi:hypothetical protein